MRRIVPLSLLLVVLAGCNTAQIQSGRQELARVQAAMAEVQTTLAVAATQKAEADAQIALLRREAQTIREAAATQPGGPTAQQQADMRRLESAATQAAKVADQVGAVIGRAQSILAQAESAARTLADGLAKAESAPDVAQATVNAATPLIPGPWGAIVGLLATTLIGFWRAAYNRAAGRSIARSIELSQGKDGVINLDDEATREDLRARQGSGGSRLVDEAQGKAMALPF